MTDPLQTTWAELTNDDTVLDATGKQWQVYSSPVVVDGTDTVQVAIMDGERYITVTKNASDTVLTVPAAVADITDGAVATESATQTQTRQTSDTFPSADTLSPLELRTHLYLVHGDHGATKPMPQADMVQWHTDLHSRGPGSTPHTHQEAT